jgi:hypothetical protein
MAKPHTPVETQTEEEELRDDFAIPKPKPKPKAMQREVKACAHDNDL